MELECEFKFEEWTTFPHLYTCVITSAAITKPRTLIKAINGIHLPGRSNKNVEAIKFANTVVKYFPRGLQIIFPGLIVLQISSCGLKEIERSDLVGLEALSTLVIYKNQLTSLPDNLFTGMQNLKRFSFGSNKLETVSSQLLKPLKLSEITLAGLQNNSKIDAFYQRDCSSSVESLEKLMQIIDKSCSKPQLQQSTFQDKFSSGFKDLWSYGRFSDFVVYVGSKEFRVHKNVLSIQSSVFSTMFDHHEVEENKTNSMVLEGFTVNAVEEFLRYMYCGEVLQEDTNAMELFALAAKYDVLELQQACEDKILLNLCESNALEILVLGNLYSSDDLKEFAFHKIKQMFPEINLRDELMNQPEHWRNWSRRNEKLIEKSQKLLRC